MKNKQKYLYNVCLMMSKENTFYSPSPAAAASSKIYECMYFLNSKIIFTWILIIAILVLLWLVHCKH